MGYAPSKTLLRRANRGAICVALVTGLLPAVSFAETTFPAPVEFNGRFSTSSAEKGKPIFAGSTISVEGSGLKPGQKVSLQRGATALLDAPLVADDKGAVSGSFALPADAETGIHPVVALLDGPSAATIIDLKISREVPVSGADHYAIRSVKPAPGLYQSAYSARADALFVTSASFRPIGSALLKLNPETLEEIARVTPAADPAAPVKEGEAPTPVAVLGIGVDDAKGTVWVTNTFDNTLAVYAQDDLALVKQFPANQVYHSRDVKVDAARGRAYVSSGNTDSLYVFDTESLAALEPIRIRSAKRGGDFSLLGLAIDPQGKWLFGVSRETNELAVVDLESGKLDKIIDLVGAKNASGVDYDPVSGKLFVAAQDSDNLLIVDLASGTVEHSVTVGAGPLNVAFDPVGKLAYVVSRGAGSVAAVSLSGELVANLAGGNLANHVAVDGKGDAFVVNKSLGAEDDSGDQVTRISPAK